MAAKAEGLSSKLRLIMEKGPLEGQSLEFVPGSKIRIGRIIRGNTIAVKDAGVSTKHLAINFEVESGKWTLSDLGSSNGTFLNDDELEPLSPVQLSDGDEIKIGECTSIRVEMIRVEEVESGKVTRNLPPRSRRGQMGKGKRLLVSDEVSGSKDLKDSQSIASKEKEGVLEDKFGVENVEENENVRADEGMEKLRPFRGRGAQKKGADPKLVADGMERNQGNVQSLKRVTRSARNEGILESKEIEKVLPVPVVKDEGIVSIKRVTRSMVKEGNREELEEVRGKKNTKKGRRGQRNSKVQTSIDAVEEEMVKEVETVEEVPDLEVRDDAPVKEVLQEDKGRGVDVMLEKEVRHSDKVDCGAASVAADGNLSMSDLEKMTLGDWLKYLEVYLTKQIVDESEQMIADMRQKAEIFQQFMAEQKDSRRQG